MSWETMMGDSGRKIVETDEKEQIMEKITLKANDVIKIKLDLYELIEKEEEKPAYFENIGQSGLGKVLLEE